MIPGRGRALFVESPGRSLEKPGPRWPPSAPSTDEGAGMPSQRGRRGRRHRLAPGGLPRRHRPGGAASRLEVAGGGGGVVGDLAHARRGCPGRAPTPSHGAPGLPEGPRCHGGLASLRSKGGGQRDPGATVGSWPTPRQQLWTLHPSCGRATNQTPSRGENYTCAFPQPPSPATGEGSVRSSDYYDRRGRDGKQKNRRGERIDVKDVVD